MDWLVHKVSLKASHHWSLTARGVVICARTPGLGCAEGWTLLWTPGQVLSLGRWCLSWSWFSDGHTPEQAVPWACPLISSRERHQRLTVDMLKFFISFLEGLRSGKSCKNTGEKLATQWRQEINAGVRESRAEGLPLTLAFVDTAQHYLHTVLNLLGNLSSENAKSENLKRVLEEH